MHCDDLTVFFSLKVLRGYFLKTRQLDLRKKKRITNPTRPGAAPQQWWPQGQAVCASTSRGPEMYALPNMAPLLKPSNLMTCPTTQGGGSRDQRTRGKQARVTPFMQVRLKRLLGRPHCQTGRLDAGALPKHKPKGLACPGLQGCSEAGLPLHPGSGSGRHLGHVRTGVCSGLFNYTQGVPGCTAGAGGTDSTTQRGGSWILTT